MFAGAQALGEMKYLDAQAMAHVLEQLQLAAQAIGGMQHELQPAVEEQFIDASDMGNGGPPSQNNVGPSSQHAGG